MIESNYFYKNDIEWNNYIMIPRKFILDEKYRKISAEAKIMYGLLMDRLKVSLKNNWIDEEGRCYLIYSIKEICKIFDLSNKTAIKLLKELESLKILEKKKQGQGKPDLIYVKKIKF